MTVGVPEESVDIEIQQSSDDDVCSDSRRLAKVLPRRLSAGSLILSYVIRFEAASKTGADPKARAESVKQILETVSKTVWTSNIQDALRAESEQFTSVDIMVDTIGAPVLAIMAESSGSDSLELGLDSSEQAKSPSDLQTFIPDVKGLILCSVALLFPICGLWIYCRRARRRWLAEKEARKKTGQISRPWWPSKDRPATGRGESRSDIQGVSEVALGSSSLVDEEEGSQPVIISIGQEVLDGAVSSPEMAVVEPAPSDSDSSDLDIFHPYPLEILPRLAKENGRGSLCRISPDISRQREHPKMKSAPGLVAEHIRKAEELAPKWKKGRDVTDAKAKAKKGKTAKKKVKLKLPEPSRVASE